MPRGPRPSKKLKLDDIRPDKRQTTPENESPSPYQVSPKAGESFHETRFPFPAKGDPKEPFPHGLPHANHYGAIRPRPFEDDYNLKLLQPPNIANWRPYSESKPCWERPFRDDSNSNLRRRSPPPRQVEKKVDSKPPIDQYVVNEMIKRLHSRN